MRNLTALDTATASIPSGIGQKIPHESAERHVAGSALYVDDIREPQGLMYAAVIRSAIAKGKITRLDLTPVLHAPGVVTLLTLDDIPGITDIGPVFPGDPILTSDMIAYAGQPIAVVAARTERQARQAARLAVIEYAKEPPQLDAEAAVAAGELVRPSHQMQIGEDIDLALSNAPIRLEGKMNVGGQEHLYLEGQVSMAVPCEEGGMLIYTSSQHPSEVQKLVAEVLHIPFNRVTVDMRRMGGGFGGKETQAAPWACLAALVAKKIQKPVKLRLPRVDDMVMTGKRHPFVNHYRIGTDEQGRFLAADITVIGNGGHSPDLTDAIVDRAMFHADNAYFLSNARIQGHRARTNTVSHTAFRGFGGPQGMMIIERAMDDIARRLGCDTLEIRKRNLYQAERDVTPYHQDVDYAPLHQIIETLEESSQYWLRRAAIRDWNANSPILKKGLALTPVKFGISFTVQHLNQAGALIHLYTDGSVQVNHGGTEMGQGLHTKVAQIVAQCLGISCENILITATRTDKVPNTSPTAASSGTDLNGKAAEQAALILKQRLSDYLAQTLAINVEQLRFADGRIWWTETDSKCFAEVVQDAYLARVPLSATGYYKTPKIWYDRTQAKGRPFFYFAMGAAVSEVLVDTLTGEYRLLQTDILHDVGQSLNPAIDIGQIEGGFIQGMGWLTTEELVWNPDGILLSNSPATYKIPAISDAPPIFNVALYEQPNPEATIYHSKAVGEPPFMLAISVWSALRDAISSLSDYRISPDLDTPATPERVLTAINALRFAAKEAE
ncbi:xanthine dehydrogenase molybdopterin binding subunit [Nitrincola tibetensis]|uniref:Xanthine dehydrogenase molybdopterin binding subunit n=1 Tax=Nitrincola tibetensis TaxID=2219697 RepID=A0A364NP39_9GAMM|nr:xanthine dehydrogenase molybdopterin binding subunit [Nitrincola tibetensis]RAU18866.1 xanthine dehydrogenase molybdopterin binding subunit [Nitrincola tibetensis]